MLDFICMCSAELFATDREQNIQNGNICLQRDLYSRHAIPEQVNQRFRPLSHDALMMIRGLMSYRIVGYKLIKPLRENTCQLIMFKCVFKMTVRLNGHFLYQCGY